MTTANNPDPEQDTVDPDREGELRRLRASVTERLELLRFGKPPAPDDAAAFVLDAFRTETAPCLDAIGRAVDAGDTAAARTLTHDLTSVVGNVGLDDMVDDCRELTRCLRAGDGAGTVRLVAALRRRYAHAVTAVADL